MLRLVVAGQADERGGVEGGADVPVCGKAVDHEGEAGPSSPSSASKPIGCSGEVMPVLRDLLDIKASLATRMALWVRERGGCRSLGDVGSLTLDLAQQNDSLAAAGWKSSSFGSTSMSSVSSLSLARSARQHGLWISFKKERDM